MRSRADVVSGVAVRSVSGIVRTTRRVTTEDTMSYTERIEEARSLRVQHSLERGQHLGSSPA